NRLDADGEVQLSPKSGLEVGAPELMRFEVNLRVTGVELRTHMSLCQITAPEEVHPAQMRMSLGVDRVVVFTGPRYRAVSCQNATKNIPAFDLKHATGEIFGS